MKNGLYAAEFKTPMGAGFGVVTLLNGQLTGGDSSMYYIGTYSLSGDKFTAEVKTGKHHHVPGINSVFGKDVVNIKLSGTVHGDTMQATGTAPEAPGISFSATLQLVAVGA